MHTLEEVLVEHVELFEEQFFATHNLLENLSEAGSARRAAAACPRARLAPAPQPAAVPALACPRARARALTPAPPACRASLS